MQHEDILKQAETIAHEKDHYWLTRAKGLLQSDLWSTDRRLDHRPNDEGLLTDKERLEAAIDKIESLI